MTAPELVEVLQRRVTTLETEHFMLVEKLRRVENTSERTANSLDELEDSLVQLATRATADPMAEAMLQDPSGPEHGHADPGTGALTAPGQSAAGGGAPVGGIQPPTLPVLYGWVQDHIAPLVRKTTTTGEGGGVRWCRRWWQHIDAVERFIALYLTWEELSNEDSATWLSVFLRDHLDPHLATLTSPYGPFYLCSPGKHSDNAEPLGTAEAPSEHQPT